MSYSFKFKHKICAHERTQEKSDLFFKISRFFRFVIISEISDFSAK